MKKKWSKSSASFSGGNQVDSLPPASSSFRLKLSLGSLQFILECVGCLHLKFMRNRRDVLQAPISWIFDFQLKWFMISFRHFDFRIDKTWGRQWTDNLVTGGKARRVIYQNGTTLNFKWSTDLTKISKTSNSKTKKHFQKSMMVIFFSIRRCA